MSIFQIPRNSRMGNFSPPNDSTYAMTTSLSRLCLFRRYFWDGCLRASAVFAAERCLPVDACHLCSVTFGECSTKQLTPTFVDSIREPHSQVFVTAVDQLVSVCMESWCLDESDWVKVSKRLVLKLISYVHPKHVTFARSRNANKRGKAASERGRGLGRSWVIFDLWSDYCLCILLKTPRHVRGARHLVPHGFGKKGEERAFAHIESEDSFSQATQPCTCTNTHLGGDKTENSSFSSAQPSPSLAAWQPFSAIYLLVGNNIDIHQCSHEGTKRSDTRDSGSTGACHRGFAENRSPQ